MFALILRIFQGHADLCWTCRSHILFLDLCFMFPCFYRKNYGSIFLFFISNIHLFLSGNRKLYFVPNNAGLFSVFLQTKAMYAFAISIHRKLVMVPTRSIHYGNSALNICSIFNISSRVSCQRIPPDLKCSNTIKPFLRKANICFNGMIGTIGYYGPTKMKYPTGREVTFRLLLQI